MSESYLGIAGNSLFLSALTSSTTLSKEQARGFTKIKARETFRETMISFLYVIASMKKKKNQQKSHFISLHANIEVLSGIVLASV